MQIYAHRGASRDYPEHTEAAYLAAVAQGADGFECDLRLSRDEIPVLWHDASMQRQAGHPGLISELNYREILNIYPEVLTLNQFLDIALAHQKGLFLETKHPVISGNRIEELVAQIVGDRNILESVDLSILSFSWSAIEKLKRINPSISRTYLISPRSLWLQARYSSADQLAPGIEQMRRNPALVAEIHKVGKKVAIWTVDEGRDVELARDLGVDALITNRPAHARTFL